MSNQHKITVAIPTFDRELYLNQTLESLLLQTEKSFRVIIFDNASPYDIESLIAKFPTLSIELRRNTTNIGNLANFELIMAHAFDTPYIMIFHDDDTIHPEYFRKALEVLENNHDIGWLGSFIRFTKNSGQMVNFQEEPPALEAKIYTKQKLADAFMRNEPIGFSSVIYRQQVLAETKPDVYRFNKWLDRPFMLEACNYLKAAILPFPYINYRIHPAQDSVQPHLDHIPQMINLIEYIHNAGAPGKIRNCFATTSALRTSVSQSRNFKEFKDILVSFKTRNLFYLSHIRPYSIYWVGRILSHRLRCLLHSK